LNVAADRQVQAFTTLLVSKDAPVVIFVNAIQYVRDLNNAGLAAPWDDYLKDWEDYKDFNETLKQAMVTNGKTIAFCKGNEIPMLGFNKQLLKDFGIDEKSLKVDTWDDYAAISKKMTDSTKEIAGAGLLFTEFFLTYNNFDMTNGGKFLIQEPDGKIKLNFTNDNSVKTFEFLRKLVQVDKVAQKNISIDLNGLLSLIWQNKISSFTFYPTWAPWFASSGMPAENIKIVPFPKGSSGEYGTPLFPATFMLNAKRSAEEKAAGAEYIKFMYGKEAWESQLKFAQENKILLIQVPPYNSIDWSKSASGLPADWIEPMKTAMNNGKVMEIASTAFTPYIINIMPKMMKDPDINIKTELEKTQKLVQAEWLDRYNKDLE
jgi:ABC-type glycerol-3-phosphate transport system substrate-binding protein